VVMDAKNKRLLRRIERSRVRTAMHRAVTVAREWNEKYPPGTAIEVREPAQYGWKEKHFRTTTTSSARPILSAGDGYVRVSDFGQVSNSVRLGNVVAVLAVAPPTDPKPYTIDTSGRYHTWKIGDLCRGWSSRSWRGVVVDITRRSFYKNTREYALVEFTHTRRGDLVYRPTRRWVWTVHLARIL